MSRVLNDRNDALELLGCDEICVSIDWFVNRMFEDGGYRTGELSRTLVQVDIGLLADEVGVSAADTLDLGQGVDNLLLAVNVGVEQTQDELEVRL